MNETDTLAGLIAKARRERGTSVRQLAIQAKAAKYRIVGTTLNAIENGTYKSDPSDETLRAIAWLAGVPESVAFTAAGRRLPGPPFADELPPGVDDLSPKEREAAITLLRVLVAQRQEIRRHEDLTESRTQEGSTEHGGAGSRQESRTPSMTTGKARALIDADQGTQLDYDLAQRRGETQREYELRTQVQPEDESQDAGLDGDA
ncbi:hypothetical protein CH300_00290 [Rhodococcus sp. 15-1154-1]|nr:helix-turn-helix transcriptional regulator [Rhodococcus sp. 15-1154-1]OZF09855.1 hypothetical protein CH300_00290 [Rhodococcus sp. 15-1154-1]